jgi:DNA topoisomerase II
MVGFNSHKRLYRYPSVKTILEEFYGIRLIFYEKRKEYLISRLQRDLETLENKERFIIEVVEEKIIIRNVKKKKII